ncbi:MAG: ABC transporter ATP-binding protein [Dehalococcoidales bacterium]
MRKEPILIAENIVAGYGDADILHSVTVEVFPDEIVCIIGPNGSGKSTLMKTIAGLLKAREGRLVFEGEEISGLPPHRITARGLSYVPQSDNIFPNLTVEENLEMGGFLREKGVHHKIKTLYGLFPALREKSGVRVAKLSGGQRQMVALARALMLEPRMLLLDEPSAGLSPIFVETLYEQIHKIHDMGVSILIVEQNAVKALQNSHRCYVLAAGENRFQGSCHEVLGSEELGRLYLGR